MNFKSSIKVQLTSPSSIINLTDHLIYLYIFNIIQLHLLAILPACIFSNLPFMSWTGKIIFQSTWKKQEPKISCHHYLITNMCFILYQVFKNKVHKDRISKSLFAKLFLYLLSVCTTVVHLLTWVPFYTWLNHRSVLSGLTNNMCKGFWKTFRKPEELLLKITLKTFEKVAQEGCFKTFAHYLLREFNKKT